MSYGTQYIDEPKLYRKKAVGRARKMPNNKSTVTAEASKATSKKYAKTRGEHFKDIVIAILITAVLAFIGGMVFANKQQATVNAAVKAAQATVTPSASAQSVAPASK